MYAGSALQRSHEGDDRSLLKRLAMSPQRSYDIVPNSGRKHVLQREFNLLGALGRIGESGLNILLLEIRVRLQDLLDGVPGRKQPDDGSYRDSHSADARSASHHLGVVS